MEAFFLDLVSATLLSSFEGFRLSELLSEGQLVSVTKEVGME